MQKIKYEFDEKIKTYHPDFYNKKNNLIIEIKSDYIYNKDVDKNIAKKKSCISQGYNFIFIINKNYSEFENIVFS
jgi:very-short-patch-repair endonuclease